MPKLTLPTFKYFQGKSLCLSPKAVVYFHVSMVDDFFYCLRSLFFGAKNLNKIPKGAMDA